MVGPSLSQIRSRLSVRTRVYVHSTAAASTGFANSLSSSEDQSDSKFSGTVIVAK